MLNAIAITLSYVVILLLPGWAVFMRFLLPAEKGRQRRFLEDLFFIIFTSFVITTAVGIILALLGAFHFSILFLVDVLLSLVVLLTGTDLKSFKSFFNLNFSWQDVVLLNIILISAFVYLSPAEDIFGGMDSGIYVNTGVNLVREGKVTFSDPIMQKVPENLQSTVASVFKLDGYGLYFMGDDQKELIGQFLPGFSVWIAISYSLLGLNSFLILTPFIALLGMAAIYFFGSSVFNRTAGLIGTFLLSINILYLWFSRQALSEIMANMLIFGGMYYLSRFLTERTDIFSSIAGLAFGAALLVRLDSVLLLLPLLVLLFYYKYKKVDTKSRNQTFFIVFAFVILAAVASFIYYKNYFKLLILYFLDINLFKLNGRIGTDQLKIEHLFALGILVFAALLLVYIYKKSDGIKKRARKLGLKQESLLLMLSGLLTAVLIFEQFIRPALPFRFISPQANSLKRLGWYFLPLKSLVIGERPVYDMEMRYLSDIFIIFFGLALVFSFIHSKRFPQFFAFLVFFTYSAVYFNNLMTVPNHFWLNRRFISVILPFVFICAGYLISEMLRKNVWTRIIGIVLLLAVSFSFIDGSIVVADHKELGRSVSQLEKIAEGMKEDALYIMDAKPELQYHLVSLPLKYIFGRNVVLFEDTADNRRRLASILPRLRDIYPEIYFCSDKWQDFSKSGIFLTLRDWDELLVRRFEHTTVTDYRPPSRILDMRIAMRIYKIEDRMRLASSSRYLNVGTGKEEFLTDGFFEVEEWGKVNIRWTMSRFSLFLPRPKDYNTITVTMANSRPPNEPPPFVEFFIYGIKIADFYVLQGFQEYSFKIPDGLLENLRNHKYFLLEGASDTWMPKKTGVNKDVRELGVAVDSIRLTEEISKNEKPL